MEYTSHQCPLCGHQSVYTFRDDEDGPPQWRFFTDRCGCRRSPPTVVAFYGTEMVALAEHSDDPEEFEANVRTSVGSIYEMDDPPVPQEEIVQRVLRAEKEGG